jgi:hypothetical protein
VEKEAPPKRFANDLTEKEVLPKLLETFWWRNKLFQNFWERAGGKRSSPKIFGNDLVEKEVLQKLLETIW